MTKKFQTCFWVFYYQWKFWANISSCQNFPEETAEHVLPFQAKISIQSIIYILKFLLQNYDANMNMKKFGSYFPKIIRQMHNSNHKI